MTLYSRLWSLLAAAGLLASAGITCDDRAALDETGATGESVELELWTWALRPWFDDYMTDLVADFEAQHPGVEVTWVDVPADAMRRKMFAVGAAGELPDVINFAGRDFGLFANLGALRPMDDLAPRPPGEVYVKGALEAGTVDGQTLGVPWYLSTPIRVMNTRLLVEGGLTPETVGETWDELVQQAGPFHERTGKFLLSLPLGTDSDLPAMLMQNGIDPVVQQEDGTWQSNLGDPRVIEYLRPWVALYRAGHLPREAATEGYEQMVKNYTAGRVALINGDATRAVRTQAPSIYAATQIGPGVTGTTGAHSIAVTFVSISRQSEHPEWAAKLAYHVTSPKWQERLARQASRVPGTAESLEEPESFMPQVEEGEEEDSPMRQATRQSARQMDNASAFVLPIGPWPDMWQFFNESIKRALLDGEPLERVLGEIDREWTRILEADAAGLPYK